MAINDMARADATEQAAWERNRNVVIRATAPGCTITVEAPGGVLTRAAWDAASARLAAVAGLCCE